MTVVRTLDTDTIERIAAGEVITRPANVVTELVENALDADATRISITVENGGLDRLQVSDDGHGMDEADAALAVERHTTSKIEDATDVDRVETLGFRGEALPSIATVARLELTTKTAGSVGGTRVTVEDEKTVEPAGRGVGTTVEVTELFSRLPARRASLGSPTQEFGHISRAVSRYALCHPDVRIRLIHDGNTVLSTPGTGRTDAILSVYDRSIAGQSTEFASEHETDAGVISVEGSLVYPAVTRSKPTHVYTAVNGRALSEATIRNATVAGYESLLASDRYPIAIVTVTLPPERVDVNVHPAKESVRFDDNEAVATAVEQAVSEALSGRDLSRRAEFSFDGNSIDTERTSAFEDVSVIGQFRELYLLCEKGDDLLVLDQHAAHERITYERLQEQMADAIESVELDPPQTLSLTPAEGATLDEHRETIESLGFQVEPFGNTTYRVTELPAPLGRVADGAAVQDVLDAFLAGEDPEDPRDALLADLACHPSLRAGETVSAEEAAALIEQLGACEQPYACPHGRPTVLSIDEATLARNFERPNTRFE
ncbi:DNA mismatch repair endonuclease MutL [Halocatena pleomorpha]|uniref:DNA mismatch repair protein MutL n=1 Tax=Halocatena pleomorpha TaxID=1785090 RepID=A0A3P3RBZ3_9EURY|nr:DNA mismatch repair endonuclease MutL [Halocatena pleomorpha]RRJ30997.1 DNA mismatch repair endonuclease MutL [Halocatena pleomorpha]